MNRHVRQAELARRLEAKIVVQRRYRVRLRMAGVWVPHSTHGSLEAANEAADRLFNGQDDVFRGCRERADIEVSGGSVEICSE